MIRGARAGLGGLALLLAVPAGGVSQPASVPVTPGTYASRQYVSSRALTMPSRRYLRVRTTSILLHRVRERADGGLVAESRYCSVEQEPLGGVRTTLGPSFVAAMPGWEARLEADPAGGPDAVRLVEHAMVLGAALDDPAADPLPTDADDPRVTDPDADGRPGVTVRVEGMVDGEVYLVQRLVRGLRGTVEAGGRIRGAVTGGGEQSVVGASNAIIRAFTPEFEHNPDPERNTFVWVPVPEGTTCESVVADRDRRFGEE